MATLTRNPTSDVTSSGAWSGTAGSRYTLVNDYPSQDTLDQLTHGTAAGAILFGYDTISIGTDNAISAVRIYYYDREASTGANNISSRLRIGGTDYDAATHNPTTTTTLQTDVYTTNPRTGVAWTVDDVNGVGSNALTAFGLRSGDANPNISITSIQMEVTYFAAYRMTADRGTFTLTGVANNFIYYKMPADAGRYGVSGKSANALDAYPGAVAAFSLRKLRSGYTGNCIRVQRSSDNTEQNIGFGSDGFLDESALTSFVGSGTGLVVTWYDQSTNGYDAIGATQFPRIVNAGTTDLSNGRVAIFFSGVSVLSTTPGLALSSVDETDAHLNIFRNVGYAHTFAVARSTVTTSGLRAIFNANVASNSLFSRARVGHVTSAAEGVGGRRLDADGLVNVSKSGTPSTDQYVWSGLITYADAAAGLWLNGSSVASSTSFQTAGNTSNTPSQSVTIGRQALSGTPWVGYIQEIIVYNTDQRQNRVALETHLNADWAVYADASTATLSYGRTMTADAGTFTLTGVDVTLTVTAGNNYSMTADVGTFTLTGEDAALQYARIFTADTVSYSLTGIDTNFIRTYQFSVDVTTYTLAGQDVTLVKEEAMTIFASHGDFVVTANDANLIYPRSMTADTVSFTLTGQDAGLAVARQLSADLATYAFTGQDAIVRRGYPLTTGAGTFTVTTYEAQFVLVRANKGNLIAFFL